MQVSSLASLPLLLARSQPGKSVAVHFSESPRGRAGQRGARAGGWACRERQAPASFSRVAWRELAGVETRVSRGQRRQIGGGVPAGMSFSRTSFHLCFPRGMS